MLKQMSDGPDGVYSALRTCPSIKMGMEDEPVFFYIPPPEVRQQNPLERLNIIQAAIGNDPLPVQAPYL